MVGLINLLIVNSKEITLKERPTPEIKQHQYQYEIVSDGCIKSYSAFTSSLNDFVFDSVPWQADYIAVNSLNQIFPQDAISFRFGGCLMASFRYNNANCYVAHIHMGTNARLRDFCSFIGNNKSFDDLIVFRPKGVEYFCETLGLKLDPKYQSWGVIDSMGSCYSIFVEYKNNSCYHVLRIFRHLRDHRFPNCQLSSICEDRLSQYIDIAEGVEIIF